MLRNGSISGQCYCSSNIDRSVNSSNFCSSLKQPAEYKFANSNEIEELVNSIAKSNPVLAKSSDISLNEWISQFETQDDRIIALKLLENFEYYDIKKARNALKRLHQELMSRIDAEEDKKLDQVVFLFAGNAKSGAMMAYLYSQANCIKVKGELHKEMKNGQIKEKFYPLEKIESHKFINTLKHDGVKNLVIIDDIIMNGGGIGYYFTPSIREGFKQFAKVFCIILVANNIGLTRTKDGWPERNAPPIPNFEPIYDKEVLNFDDPDNHNFTCNEKVMIQKWLDKYMQIIDPSQEKKFDRSKSLVGFDWNIPGTTPLPFCFSTNKWKALFQRYSGEIVHKIITGE